MSNDFVRLTETLNSELHDTMQHNSQENSLDTCDQPCTKVMKLGRSFLLVHLCGDEVEFWVSVMETEEKVSGHGS